MKKNKIFIFIILGFIIIPTILIFAIYFYRTNASVRIDATSFFEIEISGMNNYGTAALAGNDKFLTFTTDYSNRIKWKDNWVEKIKDYDQENSTSYYDDFFYYYEGDETSAVYAMKGFLYEYISLSQSDGLSNGDIVSVFMDDDPRYIAEMLFNCKISQTSKEKTVEGLEDPIIYDPFSNLLVEFYGKNGSGSISLTQLDDYDYSNYINYLVSQSDGLSNGDSVTVYISDIISESLLSLYGVVLSSYDQEYIVSGLPGYAYSVDYITDEVMTKMQTVAETQFTENFSLDNFTYIGNVFLFGKEGEQTPEKNVIYLIYETETGEYVYCKFGSIVWISEEDGGYVNSDNFTLSSETYESLDSLIKEIKKDNKSLYNITINIDGYET